MTKAKIETQVEGLGDIYYCNDSAFDDASKAVLGKATALISFRDLAYARIKEGKDSSVSQNGSYVREGSLFVPNADNKRIWLRESLVLQNPIDAVKAHKKGNEYLLPEDFNVDAHLEKVGKGNYLVLTDTSAVPTDRFGEDARTVWAFDDQAKEYGAFLKDAGISASNIWMYTDNDKGIDKQSRPFANQLWLRGLGSDSDFSGGYRDLGDDSWVRGVRRESAEGGALKNVGVYTPTEFLTASGNVGLVITGDLEKTLLAELDKLRK